MKDGLPGSFSFHPDAAGPDRPGHCLTTAGRVLCSFVGDYGSVVAEPRQFPVAQAEGANVATVKTVGRAALA